MKCAACNHESDDFQKLSFPGSFVQAKEHKWEDGIDLINYSMVDLYACPKCHTIRMERNES